MILRINSGSLNIFFNISTSFVWLANGLFCKVLNFVPRHQLIVAKILGDEYASLYTKAIGFSEILIAIWILSRIKSSWSTYVQIIVIASMNIIETIFAPDLLLWGRFNLLFAFLFIVLLYLNEFYIKNQKAKSL